jgi:serine/threonine-protein kinase
MGAVWEAKHLRLPGKRVVVKVLLYGGTDPVALARFRREAEIGSRLGHPNIVQVLDFNTLPGGEPYLVLEYLSGETLAARLRRGQMARADAVAIAGQIGSALAAAHREGIVHRDLKPDNIFLCQAEVGGEVRDVVKVLDFGISKMRGAATVLTQDSALVGTPQYMAPEQATGNNAEIDARTDIFALGAILFEMLAGRPPFWGDSLASVIHAVVYAPSPSLRQFAPDAPAALAAAVERALSKSRDGRFPDVASFMRALGDEAAPAWAGVATPPSQAQSSSQPLSKTLPLAGTLAAGSAEVTSPERLHAPPGPAPGAVPTDQVQRPRRSPAGVIAGVMGGIVVLVAAALIARRAPAPQQPPPPPPATTAVAAPAPPAVAPPPPAAPARAPLAEKHAAPPPPDAPKPAPAAGHRRALGAEAAADLDGAEAALTAGNAAEAIRLAQHSLYAERSGRAYAIMARARCAGGDLGNAKAALAQVDASERAAVIRACRGQGVDLR